VQQQQATAHRQVIDQYKCFFDKTQNKEVQYMALEHCADIILKFQDPEQSGFDAATSLYFESSFKTHFKLLEKEIHSNWRLHKAYFEALG